MTLIMDGLLIAGTLFAGAYCWILARRVHALKDLDKGLGGAIVTLTRQIELARSTLEEAQAAAQSNRQELTKLVAKADRAAGQLRLLLASSPEPQRRTAPQDRTEDHGAGPAAGEPLRAERAGPEGAHRAHAQPPRAEPNARKEAALQPKISLRALLAHRLHSEPEDGSSPTPSAEAAVPPAGEAETLPVPKPRSRVTPDALLRRAAPLPEPQSEAELIEALNAIASGAGR